MTATIAEQRAWDSYEATARAFRELPPTAAPRERFEAAIATHHAWSNFMDAMSLATCPRCAGSAAA